MSIKDINDILDIDKLNDIDTLDIDDLTKIDVNIASFDNPYLKDIVNTDEDYCEVCGNTGRTQENPFKCTACGRVFELINPVGEHKIVIPYKYVDKKFTSELIKTVVENGVASVADRKRIQEIFNILLEIHTNLKRGMSYTEDIYISAEGVLMELVYVFVYQTLFELENLGKSCSNILFLNETNLSDEEILSNIKTSKWLVVYLTKDKLQESLDKLEYITQKRNSLGEGTIVISNMPLAYVINREPDFLCQSMLDYSMPLSRDKFSSVYRHIDI